MTDGEEFLRLIESLRSAEAAARRLAFIREQPAWLGVQSSLEGTRELVTKLATRGTH